MRLIKMNCECGQVFSFSSCSCSLGCGTVWHSRTLFHPHNQQSTGAHPQSVEVKMKTKGGTWHDVGCIVWQGHFTLETVESVLFTVNKNKEVHKNVADFQLIPIKTETYTLNNNTNRTHTHTPTHTHMYIFYKKTKNTKRKPEPNK